MQDIDGRFVFEQLARHLHDGANAGRGEGVFARVALGQRDQFGGGPGGQAIAHREDVRRVGDQADQREIASEVIGQAFHDHLIDRHRAGGAEQNGMAVRIGARHRLSTDGASGTVAVDDDDGLAKQGGKMLRIEPADDVGRTAGWKRDNHLQRPCWVIGGMHGETDN